MTEENTNQTMNEITFPRLANASSAVSALTHYGELDISNDCLLEEECRVVSPKETEAPIDARFGDLIAIGMNTIVDTDGVQYLPVNFSGDDKNFDPCLAHHESFKDWMTISGCNLDSGFILIRPMSNIESESVSRDGALCETFFLNTIETNKEGDKLFYMSPDSKLLQSRSTYNRTTGAFS